MAAADSHLIDVVVAGGVVLGIAQSLLIWWVKDVSKRIRDIELNQATGTMRDQSLEAKLEAIHQDVQKVGEYCREKVAEKVDEHERRCRGFENGHGGGSLRQPTPGPVTLPSTSGSGRHSQEP